MLSMVYLIAFALLAYALYRLYEGDYLSAWFSSCIVALLALMSLSIPRRIRIDDKRLRVDCLLDMTEIPLGEIASVRRVEPSEMKGIVPLFGGFGFFGYYGHYLDVVQVERVKLYATEWNRFVEITDIYEDRLYLSCSEPDELVAVLNERIAGQSAESVSQG